MQSLSKYNNGIKCLLCATDLFSEYALIVPLKDKRATTIDNAFQKTISKGRKPNKIWVDQGGEFYNRLFKRFLKTNIIEMYSTYNEGKPVVAERFIRTLKNKIFKHMTAISKNVYFDVLDAILHRNNNTVHRTLHLILMLNTMKTLMKKIINLKLVVVSEYQNSKIFFLKHTLKIGQKKFLSLSKLNIQLRGYIPFVI